MIRSRRPLWRCAWLVCAVAVMSAGCAAATTVPAGTPLEASASPSGTPRAETPTLPPPSLTPRAVTPGGAGAFEDPVAEEFYLLARSDLARRLVIDPDAITLVSWTPVVWPDTRLGCQGEGETYEAVEVPGYRLVLRAGGEEYVYHASFDTVFYCDPQDELSPQ